MVDPATWGFDELLKLVDNLNLSIAAEEAKDKEGL
jgi:hypothetical protein